MKTNKNKKRLFILLAAAILLSLPQMVLAQATGISGEIRWLRVGTLHSYYSEQNSECEVGGPSAIDIHFAWPGQYSVQQYTMRSRGMFLGCKDFYDALISEQLTYKVISAGPRYDNDLPNQVFSPPVEFKLVGKYEAPVVLVDGAGASNLPLYDVLDEVDDTMLPDRMIVLTTNTSIGVTVTKKVLAFTQQNHDDYYIVDYVLKNTGIYSRNGDVHKQTLKDFAFCLAYRYAFSGESVRGYEDGWGIWNSVWGRNTVNDAVGTDPTASDFDIRAIFAWYGPHSERSLPVLEDDWGCPNQLDDGVLAAAKFGGVVTLHADKSPDDNSDDPYQPRTTHYIDSDDDVNYEYSQYDELLMRTRYDAMTIGHAEITQAEDLGDGAADLWGPGIGGSQGMQGFGPYTLEPDDSIHIVVAEGIHGICREKNREVGANWLQWSNGTGNPTLIMPNGSETTDHTNYKKEWVLTCKDSLFKTFHSAVSNYESGYDIPQPPPPPQTFTVQSGGDRIRLLWADNATAWPNFDGYVIYRSEGNVMQPQTVYKKLWECNGSNAVHQYDDTSAVRGFDYYYYIQSKDDGSTNDMEPGKPLFSSMFWTLTSVPAYLRRPSASFLCEVRVVPNPYDIRARSLQFGDEFQYDRLAFYGLPPMCKLKIFTERGDPIWEKDHNDGSGDELWDSQTSSGQIVVSGIYILYLEVTEDIDAAKDMVASRDIIKDNGEILFHEGDLMFLQGERIYDKGESIFRKFVIIR